MTDHTCGNLGGKPCEWIEVYAVDGGCPGRACNLSRRYDDPACAPMLALVEARKEISELRDTAEFLHSERVAAINEAARWKRAAERLLDGGGCPPNMRNLECQEPEHYSNRSRAKCAACRLAWALGEGK